MEVFRRWGYQEVMPAAFEYLDHLSPALEDELLNRSYKLTDRSTGRLMVLRPDATLQIARLVATLLRDAPMPLRLCYRTSVYRYDPDGRHREIHQAGVELVGSAHPEADAEGVAMAVEALQRAGLRRFQVAVGHVAFFQGLLAESGLGPEVRAELEEAVMVKDASRVAALTRAARLPRKSQEALLALPGLFGKAEVLTRAAALAANATARQAVENLRTVYETLKVYRLEDFVVLDLGEIRGFHYYTGIRFEIFAEGYGHPIGSGGRYDRLIQRFGYECPATGFAVDVDRLVAALGQQGGLPAFEGADFLVVDLGEDRALSLEVSKALRDQGHRVARELQARGLEEALHHARAHGIARVLVLGAPGARKGGALLLDVRRNARKSVSLKRLTRDARKGAPQDG